MKTQLKFNTSHFGECVVVLGKYGNGALAVQLTLPDGEPLATLSVNLPGSESLPPGHFYAKGWSENEEIAEDAMCSGLFEHTAEIPSKISGFVVADCWRFKSWPIKQRDSQPEGEQDAEK